MAIDEKVEVLERVESVDPQWHCVRSKKNQDEIGPEALKSSVFLVRCTNNMGARVVAKLSET